MSSAPLSFIATNDLAAQTRGRAVPAGETESAIRRGVGWVPANLALTSFGAIADDNVFGASGDLRLLPDPDTYVQIPSSHQHPALDLYLANQTLPDGSPWDCCPRTFAQRSLQDFRDKTGLEIVASFEHEFAMPDAAPSAPFSLERLRGAEPFGTELNQLLDNAGLRPETWLPEYGAEQFEITLEPSEAIVAADRAILLRELVRDLAARHDRQVTFAPLRDPDGSGNGVHIHFSFRNADTGELVLFDEGAEAGLSHVGAEFSAGILRHTNALIALMACSPSSHLRLGPHRWSTSGIFLGEHHREALLRICPTSSLGGGDITKQYNLEFRAADATANPWLVLGALVRAGLEGITRGYTPEKIWPEGSTADDLSAVPTLPRGMAASLEAFETDDVVQSWFHPDLAQTYLDVKRSELAATAHMTAAELCQKVADVY